MVTLACKDLGAPECPFVAEGKTKKEVVEKMFLHASSAHADKVGKMKKEDVVKMMGSKVKKA